MDASGSGCGPVLGSCEYGKEPSGSFLDKLSDFYLSRRILLHGVN